MNTDELKDGLTEFLPNDSYELEPVKWLSEEVREVFDCDFPNIDHFQKHRPIIGIPKEIISEIIHKGNSMRLIAYPFCEGSDMGEAFDRNLVMIHWDANEIIDCFSGIFIGKDVKITSADFNNFQSHMEEVLPERVDPFWGLYICRDLPDNFGQVITVATKKREPLQDQPLPF